MKHYFHPMSRGITTNWMLKELDVPCEQVIIDFDAGENEEAGFRRLNPMGKVPVLVDGETVVTELPAICAYLADKYPEKGLAPEAGSPLRGPYYRALFFAGSTVEPAFTLAAAGFEHPKPSTAGWGDMARVMDSIEAMTPENGWILGDQFSAADVVYGGLLDFSMTFKLFEPSPKVAAYIGRLRERPAYIETHQAFLAIGEGGE
ncbi:glutathione S-transferase family protein [Cohaesibacter gelatinilyticus]|uniref:Glutathione S-transferase n=1 Tax=Cohaesibacter gelatinilyticus TaxID=372072 RepID=A0A285PCH5_9HYPH|nr:glutathione S-transferase family protein [Cohaesibacter gelatinilyticus]SNZ19455.1 glutathione S-transferase [Cohaesibacter gelatinilyticus]